MDKPQHPKVVRSWKVERIRNPGGAPGRKVYKPKPQKNKRGR